MSKGFVDLVIDNFEAGRTLVAYGNDSPEQKHVDVNSASRASLALTSLAILVGAVVGAAQRAAFAGDSLMAKAAKAAGDLGAFIHDKVDPAHPYDPGSKIPAKPKQREPGGHSKS